MSVTKSALLLSALVISFAPFYARAEEVMDHSKMDHSSASSSKTEVNDYYADAMNTMHKDMIAVKPTGDADVDFMVGMILITKGQLIWRKLF